MFQKIPLRFRSCDFLHFVAKGKFSTFMISVFPRITKEIVQLVVPQIVIFTTVPILCSQVLNKYSNCKFIQYTRISGLNGFFSKARKEGGFSIRKQKGHATIGLRRIEMKWPIQFYSFLHYLTNKIASELTPEPVALLLTGKLNSFT